MNDRERVAAYRMLMGVEATDRQLDLGRQVFTCCGEPKTKGHAVGCRGRAAARRPHLYVVTPRGAGRVRNPNRP